MPSRLADLLKPRLDDLRASMMFEEWCCCLTSPKERTDKHVIKLIILQSFSENIGLTKTQLGQWWIYDTSTVFHPLGLGMSNQYKLHADNLV
jgi:hypothetical protein